MAIVNSFCVLTARASWLLSPIHSSRRWPAYFTISNCPAGPPAISIAVLDNIYILRPLPHPRHLEVRGRFAIASGQPFLS